MSKPCPSESQVRYLRAVREGRDTRRANKDGELRHTNTGYFCNQRGWTTWWCEFNDGSEGFMRRSRTEKGLRVVRKIKECLTERGAEELQRYELKQSKALHFDELDQQTRLVSADLDLVQEFTGDIDIAKMIYHLSAPRGEERAKAERPTIGQIRTVLSGIREVRKFIDGSGRPA